MRAFIYPSAVRGATPPAKISGNALARKHLSKRERAQIAAAIMDGTTQVEALNQGQIARLCQVSVGYARLMRHPRSTSQLQAAE
jgi:hypothetical protein